MAFEAGGETTKDRETGTTGEPVAGRAVEGLWKSSSLQALPAIVSYRQAWQAFHADFEEQPGEKK